MLVALRIRVRRAKSVTATQVLTSTRERIERQFVFRRRCRLVSSVPIAVGGTKCDVCHCKLCQRGIVSPIARTWRKDAERT